MWGVYQPIDQMRTEIVERRPAVPAWIGFWQYVFLMPFVVAGVVIQWRRREPVLVLLLWAALVTFTAATTFGNIRYRTAAEISIVVFAAISFDAIWSAIGRRWGGASVDSEPDGTAKHEPGSGLLEGAGV
jgi:CHASE2 domain-containing sensor protein